MNISKIFLGLLLLEITNLGTVVPMLFETETFLETEMDTSPEMDASFYSVLFTAIEKENADKVEQLLLSSNVCIDKQGEWRDTQTTPLIMASICGSADIVEILIRFGADVNKTDEFGGTPLLWASFWNHPQIVALLIGKGADVNRANNKGITPLYWASCWGFVEIVDILLRAGANPNQADINGRTPLNVATERNFTKIVEILIKAGAVVAYHSICSIL